MKVLFRVDASLEMGSGHVMRCLTLANELRAKGAECHFVCRAHPGHLADLIRKSSHHVHLLADGGSNYVGTAEGRLPHAAWLGCDWEVDAAQTSEVAAQMKPDWLILDHYAIDFRWEERVRIHCGRTMVIDDLADRNHECELLLDQTLGRDDAAYSPRVPAQCVLLLGSRYALLRPEFAKYRSKSLERRTTGKVRQLLVALGGVDNDDVTSQVLEALRVSALPPGCEITIVMGATAPHVERVTALAAKLPWPAAVKTNVTNMAELMAGADLAIGAAGSSSWERCCLGLPTLMLVLAENQRTIADALEAEGAVVGLRSWNEGGFNATLGRLLVDMTSDEGQILRASQRASGITDGGGVHVVVDHLTEGVSP
jgi:UDP-2,4-diacetamido-2,4,6-trideoxy-beta-L-altropyranose hydrolase